MFLVFVRFFLFIVFLLFWIQNISQEFEDVSSASDLPSLALDEPIKTVS